MRNDTRTVKDTVLIKCEYGFNYIWITIDKDKLPEVHKKFRTLKVQDYRYSEKRSMPHAVEYQGKLDAKGKYESVLLHRFLTGAGTNERVVFKDGNSLNCTMENMEVITISESIRRRAKNKDSKFGCTGVTQSSKTGKYLSRIKVNGDTKHLGSFDNVEDAIKARKQAEKEYWR